MKKLTLSAVLSVDGNPYTPSMTFDLNQVESDLATQALDQVGTTNPDGSQTWTWSKDENIPLSIPVNLPFNIKEVLHESLALAESVTITLVTA